ncbi:hypothetical protein OEIGOIKO_01548 [Streptomyces chrestomyceticus JCM 4735]|uniref:DUF402 domain-containing protein n=1 Tax=Streptomyces chrestomyceticus JCM 4735 TaxID=1306181 RepID=A0A7U9KQZ2_9ACTN|nr:DUF402 domain-containing protein [Streptomyces chrestomyceticus]GCD33824.1 hypothetical protein OEIGOIKO_01548 [Streptomyces chrestomyceticus JCM 4735]
MSQFFRPGQIIERRELLDGRTWIVYPVRVVEDGPELLAVFLAQGTPLTFGTGNFRWGLHPWIHFEHSWQSPGVLQLQRPGDGYAVWLFWKGREFSGWYINFQEPMRRHATGFDTLDQELDIWIPGDGSPYRWKDVEQFEERERTGGFRPGEAASVRAEARQVVKMIETGSVWWDEKWAHWSPPADWPVPDAVPLSTHS